MNFRCLYKELSVSAPTTHKNSLGTNLPIAHIRSCLHRQHVLVHGSVAVLGVGKRCLWERVLHLPILSRTPRCGSGPNWPYWPFEGSRLVGGTQLVVFPRFLTSAGRRTPRAGTPTPLRAGTPLPAGGTLPPPPAPLWEGAMGKGSRLARGSRLVAFLKSGRFGRVPPTSRTRCLS